MSGPGDDFDKLLAEGRELILFYRRKQHEEQEAGREAWRQGWRETARRHAWAAEAMEREADKVVRILARAYMLRPIPHAIPLGSAGGGG